MLISLIVLSATTKIQTVEEGNSLRKMIDGILVYLDYAYGFNGNQKEKEHKS